MMRLTRERIDRLASQPAILPVKVLAIGLDDDGLYHASDGATYDEDAKDRLAASHTIIVLEYGDWPPGA